MTRIPLLFAYSPYGFTLRGPTKDGVRSGHSTLSNTDVDGLDLLPELGVVAVGAGATERWFPFGSIVTYVDPAPREAPIARPATESPPTGPRNAPNRNRR